MTATPIRREIRVLHGHEVEVKVYSPDQFGQGPLTAEQYYWARSNYRRSLYANRMAAALTRLRDLEYSRLRRGEM